MPRGFTRGPPSEHRQHRGKSPFLHLWLANSSLLWERGRVIIPLSCALDLVELWFRAAWVNGWEGDESIKIFS